MAFKKLKLWFDEELAQMLISKIQEVYSKFSDQRFAQYISSRIDTLELKDRVEVFADAFHQEWKDDYQTGVQILLQILGPENEKETGMFTDFYWVMPIAKYVEKYGLNHYDLSMHAIEEITKMNTGEYTIRPYLEQYPKEALIQMKMWSKSNNSHVRRLSSEGVRPRLPWANKLDAYIKNPKPIIPILNQLKDDPSKYVQKSVANCLNDILKDNYEIGQGLIEKWQAKSIGKERKWIIKHALRTLDKKKDPWAMNLRSSL